ncbi:MAG: glycosyltransferase family 4 protein [Vicinamibacterales bacterium]|nr:glycosyltransferase family 4 protein [Vicinamibacterales bacterium]
MKIAYITAGAGHMYCGSCLRDHTLAVSLRAAGHDVLLMPCYTPTRTDEPTVSHERVFLGGINVYLQQHLAVFRRTPWALDRLLDYPPLLRLATRWGVSVDAQQLGAMTVSMLHGSEGFQGKEIRKLVRYLADESPDIITLPNSLLIGLAPAIRSELRAPVCCTFQGEELFLDGLGEPYRSKSLELIRRHAAHVDTFVAVSHFGADLMAGYLGIARDRIQVIPLGINLDGHAPRTDDDPQPFTVGYLGRLAPEKGLHILCEAYRRMVSRGTAGQPSRLWAAGYLGPEHRAYFARIQKQMDDWGLSAQFQYHGELDRVAKLRFLRELSVLSVPGDYEDPKGLFLLEAMASGVPVVQPRRGAATEIVESTGGGVLVTPRDPDALADGLFGLLARPEQRRLLADRGYAGVRAHYSAALMRDRAIEVYQSLLAPAARRG